MSSSTSAARILGALLLTAACAGTEDEGASRTWTVRRGDTLSAISQSVYGEAALWRRIAEANPSVNPSRLKVGAVLVIPEIPAEEEAEPEVAPESAPEPEPPPPPPPPVEVSEPAPPPPPPPPAPRRAPESRPAPSLSTSDLQSRLEHRSPEVRLEACRALGRQKAASAAPKLRDLLQDGNTRVREEAAVALGRIGDAESVAPLASMLTDLRREQPGAVRAAAAEALGRIGQADCRGPLVMALKDPNAGVRRAAIGGLTLMTRGMDRCYDPDAPEAERAAAIRSWEEWLADAKD